MKKSKSQPIYVAIDYPKENEVINHPNYTIKIGTNGNSIVEVSIDGGNWQPCRQADSFWWYDWSNYPTGSHKIIARLRGDKGKVLKKSLLRKCTSM